MATLPGLLAAPVLSTYMYLAFAVVLLKVWSTIGPVLAVGVPLISTFQSVSSVDRLDQLFTNVPGVPTVKPVKASLEGKVVTHWLATNNGIVSARTVTIRFRFIFLGSGGP